MIHAAICGSVMIALTVLLRLLFLNRLPKQSFRILWLLCALRLLVPFSFTFEVEVEPTAGQDMQTVVIGSYDTVYTELPDDTAKEAVPRFDVSKLISAVLPLGTIIIGGVFIVAYRRMRKIAVRAKALWNDADVRAGDGAESPFSCGVIRPIIFIPKNMLTLGEGKLEYIIAHERQHIKSGDQLVKWLLAAAVCINWYNPFVWIMWRYANRDIELACDEAVVRRGGTAADYALCLIEAAERYSDLAHTAVCSFGTHKMFGAKALNERIECIMKAKRLTVCGFISAALILAAMSAFFIQVTAKEAEDTEVKNETEETVSADTESDNVIYEVIEPDVTYEIVGDVIAEEDSEAVDLTENAVEFVAPIVDYELISAGFGYNNPIRTEDFHSGIDLAAAEGTEIYAAASGTVIVADYNYENGNYVIIDHGDEFATAYYHCSELLCEEGDEVEAGDRIAAVGSTGFATGPHLHFEIRDGEVYVSPAELFE